MKSRTVVLPIPRLRLGALLVLGLFITAIVLATPISFKRTLSCVDYVVGGISGVGGGTGPITISGVSGTVTHAFLYWHGINNSGPGAEYNNPTVTINGNPVTGDSLGDATTNCWGDGSSRAFEANVPTTLVPGNGIYTISGLSSCAGCNANGASLVVVFNDGNPLNNRDLVFFTGNDSNLALGFPGEDDGWHATLPGINYNGGTVNAVFHAADGQNFPDNSLTLSTSVPDTVTIADTSPPPVPSLWDGNSLPNAGTSRAGADGLWDIHTFDITAAFGAAGTKTLTLEGQEPVSDCLGLILMLLDLPCGAAPQPCGDLPCVIPPKDPGNTVTVNNCAAPPVTTFNNWTQINLPANDVVLQCPLVPLGGTDSVRIIARSIKVGPAGSASAPGKQGVLLTASATPSTPCSAATIEILSSTPIGIQSTNPNGQVKVTACGDILVTNSIMKSLGGNLSVTSTGGRICAALDSFFGNTVTLESEGDLTIRGSSVQTIGPRDFTRLVSHSGSVLAGGTPDTPCPPNSFHGGIESNMTVTAALLVDLTNACVQEAENITITGGGCAGTVVNLSGAEIRNDFGKTGDIRVTACAGLGTIDITDAVLVNEGARGGGPDPLAVSILNGGKDTTTNCPAVVPNPPNPSCNSQPIDTVKDNPVCANETIRHGIYHVIGNPKVDR